MQFADLTTESVAIQDLSDPGLNYAPARGLLVNLPLVQDLRGKVSGGVTFSRASGQWYQDDAGVWQYAATNAPAFNSKGILLEPVSTNKCTCYGVIPADLGSELVGNPEFDTSDLTGWVGASSSVLAVAAGKLTASLTTDQNGGAQFNFATPLVQGKVYRLTLHILPESTAAVGYVRVGGLSGQDLGFPTASRLVQTVEFEATANHTSVGVYAYTNNSGKTIVIERLSLKEINVGSQKITNGTFADATGWTAGAGWSIAGGLAVATDVASGVNLSQDCGLVRGRVYRVVFTVTGYVKGGVRINLGPGSSTGTPRTANGTYVEYLVKDTNDSTLYIATYGAGGTTLNIDNVSVREAFFFPGTKSFHNGSIYLQNHPNMTLAANGGNVSAVGQIVDASAAVAAAGFGQLNPSGKVYRIDNLAGAASAYYGSMGQAGNLNKHSLSVVVRLISGTGRLEFNGGVNTRNFINTDFAMVRLEDVTPSDTTRSLVILAGANSVIEFFIPQFEESAFATTPIPTAGATATRAACNLSLPTTGNMKLNDFTVSLDWEAGLPGILNRWPSILNFYLNSLNRWDIIVASNTSIVVTRRDDVTGNADVTVSAAAVVPGNRYKIAITQSATNGMTTFCNGVIGTSRTDVLGKLGIPSTVNTILILSAGCRGYIKNLRIYRRPLSDAQCIALTQ